MDIYNGFKGVEEDIDRAVQDALPVQATVVKRSSNGKTAWVRFAGEPSSSTPTQVPISQDCPVGTTVWVFRTGGGKGFAVAQGLPSIDKRTYDVFTQGRPQQAGIYSPQSISSAGTIYWDSAEITFTGLDPSIQYKVVGSAQIRQSGSGSARFGFSVTGSSTPINPGSWDWIPVVSASFAVASRVATVNPDSNGEIRVKPGIQWTSGDPGGSTVYLQAWLA